jgi:hypothetical protein
MLTSPFDPALTLLLLLVKVLAELKIHITKYYSNETGTLKTGQGRLR